MAERSGRTAAMLHYAPVALLDSCNCNVGVFAAFPKQALGFHYISAHFESQRGLAMCQSASLYYGSVG